jgi:recombination protein RecA
MLKQSNSSLKTVRLVDKDSDSMARIPAKKKSTAKKKKSAAKKKKSAAKKKAAPKKLVKPPEAKAYLKYLQGIKGYEDSFGMFDEPEFDPTIEEWFSTGVFAADKLLGGGWPIGAISECAGWEHAGKSTLIDQSMAMCQRMGGIAALIDSDFARDSSWTIRMGVNLSEVLAYKGETIEECFDGIDKFLDTQKQIVKDLSTGKKKVKPKPMLLVWDALGGTQTNGEKIGAAGDKHMMEAARLVKQNLRRIQPRLKACRVAFVVVNHLYQTPAPYSTIKSYGGNGIRFHSHTRIRMTRVGPLKVSETVIGAVTKIESKKNRVIGIKPKIEIGLVDGAGIDNSYSLYKWGLQNDVYPGQRWIKQAGQWIYLFAPGKEPIGFQKTFIGLGEILANNPDIYQAMRGAFLGSV